MENKPFLLPSELLTQNDINRINQMFESPKKRFRHRFKSKLYLSARALLCPVVSDRYYNIWSSEVDPSTVRQTASTKGHYPIVNPRIPSAVAMKYRSFTFGKGTTNDVQLDWFGHCNYISPKHATLYYDEIEQSYQLLNYSCFGTYVDNALAANNETYKNLEEEKDGKGFEPKEESKCKGLTISSLKKPLLKNTFVACQCKSDTFKELGAGWEGSLLVSHGSVLRFGCMAFVFAVVDNSLAVPLSSTE